VADRTELGERIRSARAELGWKQKHLAAEVRVEPITVSRWERGATTPDLRSLRPDVPPALHWAALRALAKEPAERPGTGAAYARLLRAGL